MASSPGLRPEPDRAADRLREGRGDEEPVPARAGLAAPQPGDAGPLPARLDVQDDHRRGGARRRRLHARPRPSTTPATAPSTASRSQRARPERPRGLRRSSTSSRPTSTRSTPSSATSARSSARSGSSHEAKKFGFYSVPPLETPADARSASGLYAQRQALRPEDAGAVLRRSTRAGSPSGRTTMLATPLQMALVAAAVADNGVEMTPTLIQRIVSPERVGDRSAPPARLAAARPAPQTAGELQEHDGRGRPGRHRHRGADPGRRRRRQDRHRRDRARATPSTTPGSSSSPRPSNPVVAGAVVVEHQNNGFGGAIAAPIAKQLMQAILPVDVESEHESHGH